MNLHFITRFNNLPKIGVKWRDEVAKMSKETAEKIAADASAAAPVAPAEFPYSGFLRDSIKAQPLQTATGFSKNRLQYNVVVGANYGHFVEFGTVNTPAQPYFVPAWQKNYPNYVDNIKNILDQIPKRM